MPTPENLNWEDKVNNPELEAMLAQFSAKEKWTAQEINQVRDIINWLLENHSGGFNPSSYDLSQFLNNNSNFFKRRNDSVVIVGTRPVSNIRQDVIYRETDVNWWWNGTAWVNLGGASGGGTDTQVINWNGYLQFTQAPTTWYHKQYNVQAGGWLTSPWNANIGSTPTNFPSSPNSERLLYNSYLDSAQIYLHNTNGARTINIKWYKFNRTQGTDTPTNIVEICNISKAVPNAMNQAFILNTDFTINNTPLNAGDFITFVINQSTDASGAATNFNMNLIFKKT